MEKIIERAKSILMAPKEAMTSVKTEEMPFTETMKSYVAIMAAIPPIAMFIGYALIGLPIIGRQSFGRTLAYAIILYILNLVAVVIVSKVINALAPNFNGIKSETNSFKLTVYSFTPVWVAGAFNLIPSLAVLGILGSLYGIYILYLGFPILMESPKEKAVAYTVVTVVIILVVFIVIGAIAQGIAWGGGAGPARYF